MIKGMVAIVGRPNVGKSTLFNRLTRSKTAIVDDSPGVTRDRIFGTVYYDKKQTDGFVLVDTGGYETKGFNFQPFAENLVWRQTLRGIEQADLILFVVDGKTGLHHHDKEIHLILKEYKKPILFVVNKIDGLEKEHLSYEFFELGLSPDLCISAAHNKQIGALLAKVKGELLNLTKLKTLSLEPDHPSIAIIGKPNVGKSSILNRLLGEERSLVSDVAGTTRDCVKNFMTYNNQTFELIDTAGMRRRTKVDEGLERGSVLQSLSAISQADIVVLVIDAISGLSDQDAKLLHLATDRYKPVLLVVNKWDLVPDKNSNSASIYEKTLKSGPLKDRSYIPVHFVSCLTNQRVHQILEKVFLLLEESKKRIPTTTINQTLEKIIAQHTPQLMQKYSKRAKFYFGTQVGHAHPAIVVKCNVVKEISQAYQRYMVNQFREELGFAHVPIELILRGKKEDKQHHQSLQAASSLEI